ncbi:MAG: DJ-1/PfpI family protein [Prevotellaceae bacterium]|nr:DJ-1/PfpI family protein [Prevotellaceae bacterium]
MKQIYLFLADGFEEIEAVTTTDILRRAELHVTTVSIGSSHTVVGAHGIAIEADTLFDDVDFSDAELLILPGGMPGTSHLDAHEGLKQLLVAHHAKGKKLAAICAAPLILGKLGLLNGIPAICYPGYESYLHNAQISSARVAFGQQIITAAGPGCSVEFGLAIVANLCGDDVSVSVAKVLIA